jgi:large subunit ribosomal protein L29
MKTAQLREMNEVELNAKLDENLEALQNLKFQQALQQLEDGTTISKTRKEIAQIKTVLNEYKLGLRVAQSGN